MMRGAPRHDGITKLLPIVLAQLWAEVRAEASLAPVKLVPLMLPAPVLDPLASEIATLAESRKARSPAVCAMKVESLPMLEAA
jgi:hypothetical protein